jgi:hypothetical protein
MDVFAAGPWRQRDQKPVLSDSMVLASLRNAGFVIEIRPSGDDEASPRGVGRGVCENVDENGGRLPLLTRPA